MTQPIATADLCDAHGYFVRVIEQAFIDYGGRRRFSGEVSTVQAFEDNSRVREALQEPGRGRVLVVEGGGSMRRSMLGDNLAALAVANGWSGVVVFGAIRDSEAIAKLDLGVRALGTCPRKTEKLDVGERDTIVMLGGVEISPGQWLYADADGIVVADKPLH
jgi:regulator of ribonuclease activity A